MNDIFQKSEWLTHKPSNIKIYSHKTVRNFRNSIEIADTLNDLNPQFMNDIFRKTKQLTYEPSNIKLYCHNTVKEMVTKELTGPRND